MRRVDKKEERRGIRLAESNWEERRILKKKRVLERGDESILYKQRGEVREESRKVYKRGEKRGERRENNTGEEKKEKRGEYIRDW